MTDSCKTNLDFQTLSSLFEHFKKTYASDDIHIKYLDEENEEVGIERQEDLDFAYQIGLNSTNSILRLYIRNSRNVLLGRQQIKIDFQKTIQAKSKTESELNELKQCNLGFTDMQIKWLENYLENFKKNIYNDIESKINGLFLNKANQSDDKSNFNEKIEILFSKLSEARSKNLNLRASLFEEELQETNAFMAEFVKDYNLPDGSACEPDEKLHKIWVIKNIGKLDWSAENYPVKLVNTNGNIKVETDFVLVNNTKVNQTAVISVELIAPSKPGNYFSEWVLSCNDFQFGPKIWCSICVNDNQKIELSNDDEYDDEFEILPTCFDLSKKWTIESAEEVTIPSSNNLADNLAEEKSLTQGKQVNEEKNSAESPKKNQFANNLSNAFDLMKNAVSNLGSPSFVGTFNVTNDDLSRESQLNELMTRLISMGFANRDQNKRLIIEHDFNLEKIVQYLLEEMDNNWAENR
uniref:Next to BRCA1 protein n=1 Tax=Brachionus koreanus TaxID=1199090 RepID=A0A7G7WNH6_9BILA|nr:next to BRCA1 protein [Brachionus koreanus]